MSGWRLDLDQRSGHLSNHGDRRDFISVLRASRTGQRAFDETASLRPPESSMRARQPCRGAASNETSRRNDFLRLSMWSRFAFRLQGRAAIIAEINKLAVEKALNKLRASDAKQSKDTLFNDKIDALGEEIERMRTQRLRLEQHQRRRDKDNR
jgi:hypothetical protein